MRAVHGFIMAALLASLIGCDQAARDRFVENYNRAEARRLANQPAAAPAPRQEMGYQMVQVGDHFGWVRTAAHPDLCGASIIANDGTYLGKVAGEYDSDSIANDYGQHGSAYAAESMFNEYGRYGGSYSNLSPFNEYTNTPPSIVVDGEVVGVVTANQYLRNAVHPAHLRNWARKNCR